MKTKPPWYKRWWVNVLLLIALLLIIGLLNKKGYPAPFSYAAEETRMDCLLEGRPISFIW